MEQQKYYKTNYILNKIQDDYVVLNKKDKTLHLLNESAIFILEHCDGKMIKEIANEVYHSCSNQEEITKEMIEEDCYLLMKEMVERGLVTCE